MAKAPTVGKHYLRRGEFLKRIDDNKAAPKVYKSALDEISEDNFDRVKLIPRLTLIDANHLCKLDEAEDWLIEPPTTALNITIWLRSFINSLIHRRWPWNASEMPTRKHS